MWQKFFKNPPLIILNLIKKIALYTVIKKNTIIMVSYYKILLTFSLCLCNGENKQTLSSEIVSLVGHYGWKSSRHEKFFISWYILTYSPKSRSAIKHYKCADNSMPLFQKEYFLFYCHKTGI